VSAMYVLLGARRLSGGGTAVELPPCDPSSTQPSEPTLRKHLFLAKVWADRNPWWFLPAIDH
jgi:hypothetical protein